MKQHITATNIKIAIMILTAIAIGFIYYQKAVVVPQQKMVSDNYNKYLARSRYNLCETSAENSYSRDWDNKCIIEGKGENCTLTALQYGIIEKRLNDAKTLCLDIYQAEI